MKKATKKIKVIDGEEPMPVEVLADSIKAISEGIKKLRTSRLNDKALILLIRHATPGVGSRYNPKRVGATEIRAVLEGIESLETTYLKKDKK